MIRSKKEWNEKNHAKDNVDSVLRNPKLIRNIKERYNRDAQ
jgi:hypothetical protein